MSGRAGEPESEYVSDDGAVKPNSSHMNFGGPIEREEGCA